MKKHHKVLRDGASNDDIEVCRALGYKNDRRNISSHECYDVICQCSMWIDKKEAEAERLAKNPPKSTYQSPEKRAEEMLKIEEQKRL